MRLARQLSNVLLFSLLACMIVQSSAHGDCSLPCGKGMAIGFRDVEKYRAGAADENGHHLFEANGCGTDAVRVDTPEVLTSCCVVHDACYSICGVSRDFCDKEFKQCLEKKCAAGPPAERGACSGSANMLSMGVSMFGCGAFIDAQKAACVCVSSGAATESRDEVIRDVLYQHPFLAGSKSPEEVASIVARAQQSGHSKLIFQILDKYNASLIAPVGLLAKQNEQRQRGDALRNTEL